MKNIVLRFIGVIVSAVLFSYLVETFHYMFFRGIVHFFSNLSLGNWLFFDLFRGILLPVLLVLSSLIAMGITWMVKGSKVLKVIPICYFILRMINDFIYLFIDQLSSIVDEIGSGFWYYTGAVVAFLGILICYGLCIASIIVSEDN